ncbi:EVE domain-containing protein [Geodermatophilus sp. CPCC 205761]|uniref:EVE domain-containing protein n=1 Tax=Geodermatophilus sp. CPCC 205761 TaxID=2936597 RepID=UPI003EEB202C
MTDIACWVLKANPRTYDLLSQWEQQGPFKVGGWVPLRKSYRLELMAPGQRCLLWLSGSDKPGIFALGELTGVVDDNSRGAGRYWRDLVKMRRLAPGVPIKVVPLSTPALRVDLMQEAELRKAEFIRMAAGSNPSYLDPDQFKVVEGHLQAADVTAAGW